MKTFKTFLLGLFIFSFINLLNSCMVQAYPRGRVWVPGHWSNGYHGHQHWTRGHYDYR